MFEIQFKPNWVYLMVIKFKGKNNKDFVLIQHFFSMARKFSKIYLCECVNLTFKFLLTHAREDHTKKFLPWRRYILVAVHSERYEGRERDSWSLWIFKFHAKSSAPPKRYINFFDPTWHFCSTFTKDKAQFYERSLQKYFLSPKV